MADEIAHGDTEAERRFYAMGFRMGMFRASQILKDKSKEAGETLGSCPAGPWANASNTIEARAPKGEIVTTHVLR